MLKIKVWRLAILVAGVTGLLALSAGAAWADAGTNLNHCEPLQHI
ncbi:MAG TPA: hypothetical protein VGS19_36205 [Streptosporangiaceae bacterium]|nr:hypothetical protein [Streptosporangiaceae bacterium]